MAFVHLVRAAAALFCTVLLNACTTANFWAPPMRTGEVCFQGYVDDIYLEKQQKEAQECCSSYSTIQLQPLTESFGPIGRGDPALESPNVWMTQQALLTDRSPVFTFLDGGKSRFLALSLEGKDAIFKKVRIETQIEGFQSYALECKDRVDMEHRRMLEPLVTFLDADRRVISSGITGMISSAKAAPNVYVTPISFEFTIPPGAAAMIIHSDSAKYGQPFPFRSVLRREVYTPLLLGVPIPVSETVSMGRASTSHLTISLYARK